MYYKYDDEARPQENVPIFWQSEELCKEGSWVYCLVKLCRTLLIQLMVKIQLIIRRHHWIPLDGRFLATS